MKFIALSFSICISMSLFAQVNSSTSPALNTTKTINGSPARTITAPVPQSAVGFSQAEKNIPGNGSVNGTLNNLPVKTPVYNSQVTGTNSPGDVNTGLPVTPENGSSNQIIAPITQYPSGNKANLPVNPRDSITAIKP